MHNKTEIVGIENYRALTLMDGDKDGDIFSYGDFQ